jgi:hypothetical protein
MALLEQMAIASAAATFLIEANPPWTMDATKAHDAL